MSWPKFRLTQEESRFSTKYDAPNIARRHVIRRIYPGFLEITQQVRSPAYTFQISRRCRVMGFTICGDIEHMRIEFIDITGEQFTAGPIWIPNLIGGWTQNPLSNIFPAAFGPNNVGVPTHYHSPYIFEPNIVLAPNQTLSVNGSQILDFVGGDPVFRVDFCFHVYEFPGIPGSPL